MRLEGLKVVSAYEMAQIETMACAEGASEQTFMENAAEAIADAVDDFILENDLEKTVTILAGKGNNGGDAFAAGSFLLQRGFKVVALHIYPLDRCGPLCVQMHEKFTSSGGISHLAQDPKSFRFDSEGVILDGLVGTGFKGKAEDVLAVAIERANSSGIPILAVDIPSGLNGTTGEVGTIAIHAVETIFLELPKIGFFLKDGWDHVGKLRYASFGLNQKYIHSAKPIAYLLNEEYLAAQLPPIKRSRHKYQAGYVLAIAGSIEMPGAAILSSFAALRSGAGIVRLFHPSAMEAQLSSAPYELIRQVWDGKDSDAVEEESKRAKAILVGPGMGRNKSAKNKVQFLMENIDLLMVIDGDALFFLAENPDWKLPQGSVLTPHQGEMDRLLGIEKGAKGYLELCQKYAEEKGVTLVLKGAPTFIFHPKETPLIITRGDPGMATAGSGDVLTGMVAAMLAQGLDSKKAAALAVYLHGLSGEMAAHSLTSYCVTASDLIDYLPEAFLECSFSSFCEHGG